MRKLKLNQFAKHSLLLCFVLPLLFDHLAMGQRLRDRIQDRRSPGAQSEATMQPQQPAQPQQSNQNAAVPRFVDLQIRSDGISSAVFLPNGTQIATLADGRVQIWDAATGRQLRTLRNRFDHARFAAISSDGRKIAIGDGQNFNTVRILDTESGRELRSLTGNTNGVNSVAFSPDGTKIVTAGGNVNNRTARIWDAESGRLLHTLTHTGNTNSAAFSPDGKRIFLGGGYADDNTARICDVESGTLIRNLTADNNNRNNQFSFSPDERKFAVHGIGVAQSSFIVAEFGTNKTPITLTERRMLRGDDFHQIDTVTFSPDGRKVVTTGTIVRTPSQRFTTAAFTSGTVRIWTLE